MGEISEVPQEKDTDIPQWSNELVNTDDYQVFLHRTRNELAEKIVKTGFQAGADLASTTTGSGSTPEEAFNNFKRIHHAPGSVIIIRLPQRLFDEARKNREEGQNNENTSGKSLMEMMVKMKPTTIDEIMLEKYKDMNRGGIVVPKECQVPTLVYSLSKRLKINF